MSAELFPDLGVDRGRTSNCPMCSGTISWAPAWHEWHGDCDGCRGAFLLADLTVAVPRVCLLPNGKEWIRVVAS